MGTETKVVLTALAGIASVGMANAQTADPDVVSALKNLRGEAIKIENGDYLSAANKALKPNEKPAARDARIADIKKSQYAVALGTVQRETKLFNGKDVTAELSDAWVTYNQQHPNAKLSEAAFVAQLTTPQIQQIADNVAGLGQTAPAVSNTPAPSGPGAGVVVPDGAHWNMDSVDNNIVRVPLHATVILERFNVGQDILKLPDGTDPKRTQVVGAPGNITVFAYDNAGYKTATIKLPKSYRYTEAKQQQKRDDKTESKELDKGGILGDVIDGIGEASKGNKTKEQKKDILIGAGQKAAKKAAKKAGKETENKRDGKGENNSEVPAQPNDMKGCIDYAGVDAPSRSTLEPGDVETGIVSTTPTNTSHSLRYQRTNEVRSFGEGMFIEKEGVTIEQGLKNLRADVNRWVDRLTGLGLQKGGNNTPVRNNKGGPKGADDISLC